MRFGGAIIVLHVHVAFFVLETKQIEIHFFVIQNLWKTYCEYFQNSEQAHFVLVSNCFGSNHEMFVNTNIARYVNLRHNQDWHIGVAVDAFR